MTIIRRICWSLTMASSHKKGKNILYYSILYVCVLIEVLKNSLRKIILCWLSLMTIKKKKMMMMITVMQKILTLIPIMIFSQCHNANTEPACSQDHNILSQTTDKIFMLTANWPISFKKKFSS